MKPHETIFHINKRNRMRTVTTKTALMLILFAAIFCGAKAETAQTAKKYEVKVGDFTSLDIENSYNVDYKCSHDSAGLAVFVTTPDLADKIIFENNNKGKLSIEKPFRPEGDLDNGLPTITVYSRVLKDVRNAGDSTVRVINVRPTMEIKATVIGNGRLVVRDIECEKIDGSIKTGNGTLVLSGKCDNATLSNTGIGTIQADNLEAKKVSAHFFGTGTTGCWATELLKIKGVMAGKLYYRGKPEKIKNYSMGVKIYTLEGLEWTGETSSPEEDAKETGETTE